MSQKIKCLFLLFVFLCACTQNRLKWVVFYGPQPNPQFFKNVDLAIVEPDLISPDLKSKTTWCVYLSLGEVHQSRPYFSLLKDHGVLLKSNPNWPGAYGVDMRSTFWREMVLKTLIPSFIAKGYSAIFLDTIDGPISLEENHPGSKQALMDLIQDIHAQYPQLKIIPNNGLEILPEVKSSIWGVVVEDLYTHYDFLTKKSVATDPNISASKEAILDDFLKETGKPVLILLYDESESTDLIKKSIQKAERKKYYWYWSLPNLGSSLD